MISGYPCMCLIYSIDTLNNIHIAPNAYSAKHPLFAPSSDYSYNPRHLSFDSSPPIPLPMNRYTTNTPTQHYINMTPLTTANKKIKIDAEKLKKYELFQSLKEQIRLKDCRKRLEKMQEQQEEEKLLREQEEYQYFGKGGAGGMKKDYFGRVITSKNPDPSIVSNLYGRERYNRQVIYNEPQQEYYGNEAEMLARYHKIHIQPREQIVSIFNRNIIKEEVEGDVQGRASRRRSRGNTKMFKERWILTCKKNEEGSVGGNLSAEKNFSRSKLSSKHIPIRNITTKDKLTTNLFSKEVQSAIKESRKEDRGQVLTRNNDKEVEEKAPPPKKKVLSEIVIHSRKSTREGKAYRAIVNQKHNDQLEKLHNEDIASSHDLIKKEESSKQIVEQKSESRESLEIPEQQSKNEEEEAIRNERERLRNKYIENQRRFERMQARRMLPLVKNFVYLIFNIGTTL